jgi:hypothetical protein
MLDEKVASIITALRHEQWQEYESQVRACAPEDEEGLWLALGGAHGREVQLMDLLLRWPLESLRSACRYLLPAVGRASVLTLSDAQGLLRFADRLEPSYRYISAESLRPHLVGVPGLGVELGEMLRLSEPQRDGARRVWAAAFASAAPRGAANFVVRLATGKASDTQLLAMLLQCLPFNEPDVASIIVVEETRLATLLRNAAAELGTDAWDALTQLAGVSSTAMSTLNDDLEAANPHAVVAISNWLHRVSTPTVGASAVPIEHLVSRLLELALGNEQLRAHIDSAVASLLHRSAIRSILLPCISELGVVDAKVAELFGETFDEVCDKPDDFAKVLTDWLLSPDACFAAVESMLSRCSAQRAPIALDAAAFAAASAERRVKAARRLLALTHHGPTLCQFIASIAQITSLGTEGLNTVAEMLNEAVAEYPGATEGFLRAQTRPSSRNERNAAVYRGVYANLLRWRRVLARLPARKELCPTDSEMHALRSMRRRMNRDILRGAAKRSVFASLVTSVHVAQGTRFASHTQRGPTQVAQMMQASHSIELPSSELADPMRGMLQRFRLLRSAQ